MFLDEPESWRVLDELLLRQRAWLQRSRIPQSPTDPHNTNVTEGNSCSCLGAIYATFIKALHTTTLCKQLNQPLVQEAALSAASRFGETLYAYASSAIFWQESGSARQSMLCRCLSKRLTMAD